MYAEVHLTCGNRDEARRVARLLVERRLAACVQLLPVESVYRWRGAVTEEPELLLVAKTRADRFDALAAAVREAHSYAVPQLTLLAIAAGTPDYLRWIDECLDGGEADAG